MSDALPSPDVPRSNPYRVVVLVLLGGALLGVAAALGGGLALGNPVLLDAAVALWLAIGMLLPLAWSREAPLALPALISPIVAGIGLGGVLLAVVARLSPASPPSLPVSVVAAALALAAAGLSATAAGYLAGVDPEQFREGLGLSRGARVLGWILALAALAIGLAAAGCDGAVRAIHVVVVVVEGVVCLELFRSTPLSGAGASRIATELGVFRALGSRANPLASVLDAAQRQLGIDLRSTWALTVVRRSAEPLLVGLGAIGWLSTSVTVVGRRGAGARRATRRSDGGRSARPGAASALAVADRPRRRASPSGACRPCTVGHEGEEEAGPEDVLWARQHGGDRVHAAARRRPRPDRRGRGGAVPDLRSHAPGATACQNPADALRAIAYRAVMKATVGRTLAEALSENVAALTAQMRAMVQADADALGLGVEVVGFTVGGMHPPVRVAADYQAVVSAELAQDHGRDRRPGLPQRDRAGGRGRGGRARERGPRRGRRGARQGGRRGLELPQRSSRSIGPRPQEYRFRRRLETLESGLGGRHFTVLDARIQRDGGELWLMK